MPPRTRKTAAADEKPVETTATETPAVDEQAAAMEARIAELEAQLAANDEKPRNVIEAILAVMRDVRAVGKDGFNESQRFNFRGIDGTVNAVGPAMRKHGLVVMPRLVRKSVERVATKAGGGMNSVHVEVEYHFFGPGGVTDTIVASTPGESFDSGDKGTAKAMSVAFRTCLLQGLALPTQDRDPDEDSHELLAPLTQDEVKERVGVARDRINAGGDYLVELKAAWDEFGDERLLAVRVETKSNGVMSGQDFINSFVDYYRAEQQRAAQERADAERAAAGADLASQPGAVAPGAPGADERTAPGAEQSAPAESEGQRAAAEQARADVAATSAPTNAFMDALMSEIAGHADVIGVDPRAYVKDLLALRQGATSVTQLPIPVVRQYVVDSRAGVIATLRQSGRASLADALESIGTDVLPWSEVIQRAERTAGAEAPAHA